MIHDEINAFRKVLREAGDAEASEMRARKLAEGAYEAEYARRGDEEAAQKKYDETFYNVMEEEVFRTPETVTVAVASDSLLAQPSWLAWREQFVFDALRAMAWPGLDTTIDICVSEGVAGSKRTVEILSVRSTHEMLREEDWKAHLQEIADEIS